MGGIQKRKDLIAVTVAFGLQKEVLYYESSLEDFIQKLSGDFVYFPRHKRTVPVGMIKDQQVVEGTEKNQEMKFSSLTSEQRSKVKEHIKNMKKNIGREPTNTELDRMIERAVYGKVREEQPRTLDEEARKKTVAMIRKMREQKERTGSYNINKK